MAIKIIAIAAMDEGRVIGADNSIPWKIPGEQKRFAELTSGHTVLMGRNTYDSLPKKYKPLPTRKNVVVTRSPDSLAAEQDIDVWNSPNSFLEACKKGELALPSDCVWVIGGEQVYRETLQHWDEVYLTLVKGRHAGDRYFPEFEAMFVLEEEEASETHSFLRYSRN